MEILGLLYVLSKETSFIKKFGLDFLCLEKLSCCSEIFMTDFPSLDQFTQYDVVFGWWQTKQLFIIAYLSNNCLLSIMTNDKVNWETKIHSCAQFFHQKVTGHACPVNDNICRTNWKSYRSMTGTYNISMPGDTPILQSHLLCFNQVPRRSAVLLLFTYLHFAGTIWPVNAPRNRNYISQFLYVLVPLLVLTRNDYLLENWGRLYKTLNHFFNHYFVVK